MHGTERMTNIAWWRDAVIYQVYPRSFADSDGDGVGDLQGLIGRLDHLADLHVDAIWLSPISASPNADWGYDVADYTSVHPELGTLDDLDELVAAAHERGIRIVLDLVPNHTSDQHPWFVESRRSRDSERRDWYVWADPGPDGGPPNNWLSIFGGPAWTFDEATGQYWLHNFLPEQPDLNWWHQPVHDAMDEVLDWWFERGIDGFRIDVCHGIVKDRALRDNPPAPEHDPTDPDGGVFADDDDGLPWRQERRYSMNRPEVHDVLRRWRRLADGAGDRVLLGETWAPDLDALARFYGADLDELHLAFNFHLTLAAPRPRELAAHVEATLAALPEGAWPAWTLSNHDISRCATRWCGGDDRLAATAMVLLLTLPGTPVLYYGDEIGMVDVAIPKEHELDPVATRSVAGKRGRDPVRTPMQWTPDGGFTQDGVEPWLPMGDSAARNVEDQRRDPHSVLQAVRSTCRLRRSEESLRRGPYRTHHVDERCWAWLRGEDVLVACNLDHEEAARVPDAPGELLFASAAGVVHDGTELVLPAAASAIVRRGR